MTTHNATRQFIGIDGEGVNDEAVLTAVYGKNTVEYNHQRYVLMTASDASGEDQFILSAWGSELQTETCLRWILSLPDKYIPVGYALSYDYTKILKDVSREKLDKLYHPDWPPEKKTPPIIWWKGWGLRWLNNRLEIVRGNKRRTVWDCGKFFQSKFADALKAWVPEAVDDIEFIEGMKAERRNLADIDREQVERYGLAECRYLAEMMHRLRQACKDADIPLTSYFGAGSIASGLIRRHGTVEYQAKIENPELTVAISAAFIGGRFESAVHGPVHQPIYETDVSSAYPSAYVILPCLKCGTWYHAAYSDPHNKPPDIRLSYVKWNVPRGRWGPFPMRTPTLAYPLEGEGWIYGSELSAAIRCFGSEAFEITDAWYYRTECDHRPHEWVHERFAQRLAWSKEQRGMVLKLGLNAIYGKYAQQVGGRDGNYTSLVWAGLITSYTRSKLLDALAVDMGNGEPSIIAFATDGVLSLSDLGIGKKEKVLGGWEQKETIEAGAFFVANGLVLPYDDSRIRTRGYEARVIREALAEIEGAWQRDGIKAKVRINRQQFVNTKLALSCADFDLHGEWIYEVIEQGFDPSPARVNLYIENGICFSFPMMSMDDRAFYSPEKDYRTLSSDDRRAIKRLQSGIRQEPLSTEIYARWQGGLVAPEIR